MPLVPILLASQVSAAPRLEVSSPAFALGAMIPAVHTCDGADRSPALALGAPPDGTASFAIVVDDPDAPGGTWVHWLAWNIAATARGLPEGVAAAAPELIQGTNDFRKVGWGGPCPPKGRGTHRYFFRLYALDRPIGLASTATRAELDGAMVGHILAAGEWMGKYAR
jgi:Raf kinase inhibitor-like YbhB/YbcL family protein